MAKVLTRLRLPVEQSALLRQRSEATGMPQSHFVRAAVSLLLERYRQLRPEQLGLPWHGTPRKRKRTNGSLLPKKLVGGDESTEFTLNEAAEIANCSVSTVRVAAQRGLLVATKQRLPGSRRPAWVVTRADLRDWVKTHQRRPAYGKLRPLMANIEEEELVAFRELASQLGKSMSLLIREALPDALEGEV